MARAEIAEPEKPLLEHERSSRTLLPPGDFTLRPFEAWTASPIGPAFAAAAAFAAASVCGRILLGDRHFAPGEPLGWSYVWLDALNGVLFAYIPAALVLLRRGIARDLVELRPTLRCSESEFRDLVARATGVPNRRLAICGGIFLLGFALIPAYDPGFFEGHRPPLGDPSLTFFMFRNALLGWFAGHAVASSHGAASTYRLLGRDHVEVDLIDTRPLHPFARMGLRTAFAWIVCVSLVPLFWLGPGAGRTNGVIMVSVILLVTASLVYSISGVRDSVRREKAAQLDALRERIRRQRPGDTGSPPGEGARLADLIAYHDLIERAPEWPFDAPMIARLALFAALGLASWLGGALVERLLESWL
jgi:hypothetical protein